MTVQQLPQSAAYVVVGAGMHGMSTAWHLAMTLEKSGRGRGSDVVLIDKQGPGAGATGIACGCVRNLYMTSPLHSILRHSVDVWQSDPVNFGFQQVGYVSVGEGNQQADYEKMHKSQNKLEAETRNLTQALRTPQIRGRWGEMTLRRVVELAGMSPHCDFEEQSSFSSNGHALRPDMIVRLPDDRVIAVDAKTPLDAYLNSIDTESDEDRKMALKNHARQVGDRVRELSRKSYWSSIEHTPEFVVMFLPGEFLLAPALEENPGLMERAMGQGVLIATPTTLISILLGAAYGWKQEQLAENAREISELGKEMYDRLAVWADHMVKLRQSLQRSVDVFNESVGSLEHRVMVSARRFKQSGISTEKEIPPLEPIDLALRPVAASSDDDESPDHMDGLQDSTKQG